MRQKGKGVLIQWRLCGFQPELTSLRLTWPLSPLPTTFVVIYLEFLLLRVTEMVRVWTIMR